MPSQKLGGKTFAVAPNNFKILILSRIKLPNFAKYAAILKNSVATKETTMERLFLMKDKAAVEEAVSLGAKIVEEKIVI